MIAQKGDERVRRHRDAIVLALAVADDDQALGEINIPDAQADAYHQTEVTAVEQAGYQLMGAGHHAEDAADLVSRQHSRKAFGLFARRTLPWRPIACLSTWRYKKRRAPSG